MHRFTPAALLSLAAAVLLPSCTTVPGPEAKQAAAWEASHAAFRASEGWKKTSYVNDELVGLLKPDNISIKVHLYEQRGLVLHEGKHIAIDFPVSSGRKSFPTSPGSYTILEKKLSHTSNLYGKYVEIGSEKVLLSDVDTTKDKQPENSTYVGASMPNFMRLTNNGLGLHIGVVPGYPASHGCIRVPRKIMPKIYALTPVGTNVEVIKDAPPPAAPAAPAAPVAAGKPAPKTPKVAKI